jgi:hypothetical protein
MLRQQQRVKIHVWLMPKRFSDSGQRTNRVYVNELTNLTVRSAKSAACRQAVWSCGARPRLSHYGRSLWSNGGMLVSKVRRKKLGHELAPGLRRRSAAERFLGSWVRIPRGAWMFVSCECLCCLVEVSATGRSLVQRSPTDCVVCLSVIKWK